MANLRTIVSPKENIAEVEVVTVQDAQSRIKQVIVESYYQGLTNQETAKRISAIVQDTVNQYPPNMQESIRQSLAVNAQKWHYTYNENNRLLNVALVQKVAQSQIALNNKTYSLDINQILGLPTQETKAIVDKFRPLLTQDARGLALIDDYDKKVKMQIKVLASDPANLTRLDRNGKSYTVNMRNFAEMQTRYEANLKDVQTLKNEGVKLVWTSSHADASPRCSPYQGMLYSMDGTSGTIDSEKYTPLDDALLGKNGDGNGIINGYNCRHRLIEYQPKSKPPKEYDKETIRRENAINNRQRQYERDIRNLKIEERLTRQAGNTEDASQLRKDWQALNKNYEAYSLKNGRPFYEWRTRVTQDEVNQG